MSGSRRAAGAEPEGAVLAGPSESGLRVGVLTSLGCTLDAFFPQIAARWREQGAAVLTAAGTSTRRFPADDHEVLPGLTRRPSPRNVTVPAAVRAWAVRRDLDVVVTNTATGSALARLRRSPVPVLYFCHGLHWEADAGRRPGPWQLVERGLLRHTDGVVVLNEADERWFAAHAPQIPRLRLSFGVGLDTQHYRRIPPTAHPEALRILWVGEFSRRKRPMDALDVADALRAQGIPFTLSMAGEGAELDRCEQAIRMRGLEGSVRLLRHVEVAPHLAEADVLLHTAAWEGLPRVVLEALAVGRPAIGYDVKGVRDLPVRAVGRPGDCAVLAGALAQLWRGTWQPPDLPDPSRLSYREVADELLQFLHAASRSRVPAGSGIPGVGGR